MSGRIDGVHVEVAVSYLEEGAQTQFVARFDRSLGVGLQIRRQAGLDLVTKLLGGQDIETGHRELDEHFVVLGKPEREVRALLTRDACRELAALGEKVAVLEVDDDLLRAVMGWAVVEPSHIESGLEALASVATTLVGAEAHDDGPFR